MSLDKIAVTMLGAGLMGAIYWFFFGNKSESIEATGSIEIIVEGGYKPDKISVKSGQKTVLKFIRRDPSSCLEEVTIPELKIKKYLPLNEEVDIEILPKKKGEYRFQCGMNMYHGTLNVI